MPLGLTTDAQGITYFDPTTFGTVVGNESWGLVVSEDLRILSGLVDALGGGPVVLTLNSLTDVSAPTPAAGDLLRFDGADWVPWTESLVRSSSSDSTNLAPISSHILVWDVPTQTKGTDITFNGTTGFTLARTGEIEISGTIGLATTDVADASLQVSVELDTVTQNPVYFGPTIHTTNDDTQASCPIPTRRMSVTATQVLTLTVSLESPAVPAGGTAVLIPSATEICIRYVD